MYITEKKLFTAFLYFSSKDLLYHLISAFSSVPFSKQYHYSDHGKYKVWNKPPASINELKLLTVFKRALDNNLYVVCKPDTFPAKRKEIETTRCLKTFRAVRMAFFLHARAFII